MRVRDEELERYLSPGAVYPKKLTDLATDLLDERALREQLVAVIKEHRSCCDNEGRHVCPWCFGYGWAPTHDETCPRQRVLAACCAHYGHDYKSTPSGCGRCGEEAKDANPRCPMCGKPMVRVEPQSMGLQQLDVYMLVCPNGCGEEAKDA